MKINIDLKRDYISQVIQQIENFKSFGFKFADKDDWISKKQKNYEKQLNEFQQEGIDDSTIKELLKEENLEAQWIDHQVILFLSFQTRLIDRKPRLIEYSSKYNVPDDNDLLKGIKLLERKIQSGAELFPHLSRRIFDTTFSDGMLFDWGIHHFHLGTQADKRNSKLIQGRNEILYGFVTDAIIYFLIIGEHGQWADKDILMIVKNDFPELIAPFKLNGILSLEHNYTEKEHNSLRAAGANTITELDGEFYMSPGGGITTAGTNIHATHRWHFICRLLDKIEDYLQENIHSKLENLCGVELIPETIELHLTNSDDSKLIIEDNTIKLKVECILNDAKNGIDNLIWNFDKN